MLEGQEKRKSSSPGKTRSDAASDSARNRKGGIKYRKSSNTSVGLINYCLAMVSLTVAAVGFSDASKRPKVKGTINGAAVQFLVDSGASDEDDPRMPFFDTDKPRVAYGATLCQRRSR
jgi:hypothetical protein